MGKVERLEKLEQFFQWVGGEIAGRKKLQKLIYLGQELGFDFEQEFVFHYYGVYSPSLSRDLKLAQLWNLISESSLKSGIGIEYSYKLVKNNISYSCEYEEEVKNKIILLAHQPATVLEVLSTIVFLDRKGYSKSQIVKKLNELKGHLRHCFENAFRLAKDAFNISLQNT